MEGRWISVSDLMSGLMMVFLFVSISLLVKEQSENVDIKKKMEEAKVVLRKINQSLDDEFSSDLKRWEAERLKDGTITFRSPEIMFVQGSHEIRRGFRNIIKTFCPRYIDVIRDKFKSEEIHELRIVGHASSEWNTNRRTRHISNADLSLRRSWEVHKLCYDSLEGGDQKEWFSGKAITVGANYVHKRQTKSGEEARSLSRRVEFRIQPKSLSGLREDLIEMSQEDVQVDHI